MKYTLALLFVLSFGPTACAQLPGNPDPYGVDVFSDWSWNGVYSGGVWSTLDPSLPARLYYKFDYAAPIASMFASLSFDTSLPAGGPTSFLVADTSRNGLDFFNFHTCSAVMSACTPDFTDITPLVAGSEAAYLPERPPRFRIWSPTRPLFCTPAAHKTRRREKVSNHESRTKNPRRLRRRQTKPPVGSSQWVELVAGKRYCPTSVGTSFVALRRAKPGPPGTMLIEIARLGVRTSER